MAKSTTKPKPKPKPKAKPQPGIVAFTEDNFTPKEIAHQIIQLENEIYECKDDLIQIRKRSFFSKMVKGTTSDLTDAMIKQNDTIGMFLGVITQIIYLNVHNTFWLGQILEILDDQSELKKVKDQSYIRMAKDFIGESIKSSKITSGRMENIDEEFMLIRNHIIEKRKLDRRQDEMISQLNVAIHEKDILDKEHSEQLEQIIETDMRQDEKIEKIIVEKRKLDRRQDRMTVEMKAEKEEKERLEKERSAQLKKIIQTDAKQDEKIDEILKLLQLKDRADIMQTSELKNVKDITGQISERLESAGVEMNKIGIELTSNSLRSATTFERNLWLVVLSLIANFVIIAWLIFH